MLLCCTPLIRCAYSSSVTWEGKYRQPEIFTTITKCVDFLMCSIAGFCCNNFVQNLPKRAFWAAKHKCKYQSDLNVCCLNVPISISVSLPVPSARLQHEKPNHTALSYKRLPVAVPRSGIDGQQTTGSVNKPLFPNFSLTFLLAPTARKKAEAKAIHGHESNTSFPSMRKDIFLSPIVAFSDPCTCRPNVSGHPVEDDASGVNTSNRGARGCLRMARGFGGR